MTIKINRPCARGPSTIIPAAILLLASFGCGSKSAGGDTKGVLISTSLPLPSYVRVGSHGSSAKGAQFFFPQLEIYNESGDLIYSSHESIDNARILKQLPGGIQSMRPSQDSARLAEIMDAIPDFRARKESIL